MKSEIHSLTGVRAFAAWWVVLFHIGNVLPADPPVFRWFARLGWLGVDLFFVLSGFVIAYNYSDWFAKFSRETYKRFLWLRLARMYPVHIATLLASGALLAGITLLGIHTPKDFSTWTTGNFLANAGLVHAWRPQYVESWNNASWSISCEWFAYLVFPFLIALRLNRVPAWLAAICAPLLLAIMLVIQAAFVSPPCTLLIRVICEFGAGVLVWRVYCRWANPVLDKVLAIGALGAFGAFLLLIWSTPRVPAEWVSLAFPALVLGIAKSSGVIGRVLASKPALYWGRVSYSLYMTHNVSLWPLKALAPISLSTDTTLQQRAALFVYYTVPIALVAALTYHLIEEPARRWMRARSKSSRARL